MYWRGDRKEAIRADRRSSADGGWSSVGAKTCQQSIQFASRARQLQSALDGETAKLFFKLIVTARAILILDLYPLPESRLSPSQRLLGVATPI